MDERDAILATQARRDRRWRSLVAGLVIVFVIWTLLAVFALNGLINRFDTAEKVSDRQDHALFILICEFRLQSAFNQSVPAALHGDQSAEAVQEEVARLQRQVIRQATSPHFRPLNASCPRLPVLSGTTSPSTSTTSPSSTPAPAVTNTTPTLGG